MAIPREEGNVTLPLSFLHDCERLGSTQSSSVWLRLAVTLAVCLFYTFQFFGQITVVEPSREKGPLACMALWLWLGGFAVTAQKTHKPRFGSLLGRQLESHQLLAARHSHLSAGLWTSFQVQKEGASSKKKMHSVSNFHGPDTRLRDVFQSYNNSLRWPLFHMSISGHREVQ